MPHVPVFAGIGRQNQRHAPFGHRFGGQIKPAAHSFDHCVDTVCIGAMGIACELQIGVADTGFFEGNNPAHQATIDLGQDHMHGQIGRGQPTLGLGPCVAGRGGQRHLEHRHVACVQWRCLARAFATEGGRIDDGVWRIGAHLPFQPAPCIGGLERGHEQRADVIALRAERVVHGRDRRKIGGNQIRAVENDQDPGRVRCRHVGQRACWAVLRCPSPDG